MAISFCRRLGFIALLLASCVYTCQVPSKDEANRALGVLERPIIGGKPDLRHPAVGALVAHSHIFCSATLVASRVVLTAAHCIDAAQREVGSSKIFFRIDLAMDDSQTNFISEFFEINKLLLSSHPQWNRSAADGFDIGIAILHKAVPQEIARPIVVNTRHLERDLIGKKPLFLGYGLIQSVPDARSPSGKHGVELAVLRIESDRIFHGDKTQSVCHGDSGGPALIEVDGRFSVIAVNSYTTAPGVPGTNRSTCAGEGASMRTDAYARYLRIQLDQYGDHNSVCQSDADCEHCDSCKVPTNEQEQSVCSRRDDLKAETYCKPCKSDLDCADGLCHRFADGFRCVQACPSSGCCPNNTICREFTLRGNTRWSCISQQNNCPPASCADASECGLGESCVEGKCEPIRPAASPQLCLPCNTDRDCGGDGQICFGLGEGKRCTQACGIGEFCPDGFTCIGLFPGMPKQCVPTDGVCRLLCQTDDQCPADFLCRQNHCVRKDGGKFGDHCNDEMPCHSTLSCLKTIYGNRCAYPCGSPIGQPGNPCRSEEPFCISGSSCYRIGERLGICLRSCSIDRDCRGYDGGYCFNGYCRCEGDRDCNGEAYCNQSPVPALNSCLHKKWLRSCPQDWQCQTNSIGEEGFCVQSPEGVVGLGYACDALHRCRDGLICLPGISGQICVENCTATRQCLFGGRCVAITSSQYGCVCDSNSDCPALRFCSAPIFSAQSGICKPGELEHRPPCRHILECPNNFSCQNGICLFSGTPPEPLPPEPLPPEPLPPEPLPPEPLPPEPLPPEPLSPDGSTTTHPEESPKLDAELPTETTADRDDYVPQHCGCNSTNFAPSLPLALFVLWLLFMAWLRPKTKQLRVFFALCFLLSSVATADDLVHAAPPTGHSALLNGMHDIESTTWLTTATSGCDKGWLTDLRYIGTSGTPHAECHTAATQAGISIIQRLDVSGSESYPRHANSINGYAQGFAHYASRCPNIRVWIVGNEPNFTEHKSDPDCTSAAYAAAYIEVHRRVHSLPGNHVVLVASNSPYSPGCLESLRQIIKHIQQAGIQPDGFAIHAYTRAANAQSLNASYVTSTQTQRDTTRKECPGSAQWDDTWHSHFRIYIDYIRVIEAAGLAGKPVLITESGNACDPNRGNACYPNADIGYFQALYAEANRWNTQASTRTKIRAITPYRWTSNDDGTGRDFAIGQRPLLLQDLQRAFAHQYHWTTPGCGPQSCKHDGECTAPQICDTATSRCVDPKPPSCQKAEDCDSKSICSPATCPDASGICIARGAGAFSFDPAVPKPGQALKVSYQHPQGLTHIGLSFCGPTQGTGSLINIDRAANGDFRWNFAVTALIEGLYRFSFTADQGSSRIGSTNIQIAALCTDGSLRCTQDKLQKCNTDSPPPYWITIQQCPHGCDTDRCRPCSPNARQCSNGELQECRPSPPSYQWQTIEHCAYGCLEGQCAPCPPHICSEISPDSCIYQDGATCHPTQEAAPPDDPDSPLPESLSEATTHTETATPTNDAMQPEPHQPHQPDNALLPDEIARPEGAVIILEPAPPHLQPRGGCLCHASNSPFPAFSLLLFLLLAYRKRNA